MYVYLYIKRNNYIYIYIYIYMYISTLPKSRAGSPARGPEEGAAELEGRPGRGAAGPVVPYGHFSY